MSDAAAFANGRGPNCWQCRFFAISWDTRAPYACRRMGFKSQVMPAIEVLRQDGRVCQCFEPKTAPEATPSPSARPASPPAPAPRSGWRA